MVTLVHYIDVMSSWCYYAEPHVERLRGKYGRRLSYEWRIALITEGMPHGHSREQVEWFYRRSGSISGTQLNPDWCRGPYTTLEPNLAAEAARELGFGDDRVRLALARAAMIEGMPICRRRESVDVVAAVTGMEPDKITALMNDPRIDDRVKQTSEEFAALNIDQRPAFVLRSNIGDIAIFSGVWTFEPIDATIGAMLSDEDKYATFAAKNPPLPAR